MVVHNNVLNVVLLICIILFPYLKKSNKSIKSEPDFSSFQILSQVIAIVQSIKFFCEILLQHSKKLRQLTLHSFQYCFNPVLELFFVSNSVLRNNNCAKNDYLKTNLALTFLKIKALDSPELLVWLQPCSRLF